jgi:serine/threonine protein kinase
MTINAELARGGEPPVSRDEEVLMTLLDKVQEKKARGEPVRPEELLADRPDLAGEGAALLQAVEGMEALVASVLEHSGILGDPTTPPSPATEVYQAAAPDVAQRMPDPAPDEYRVRAFLGEGRFSRVWLADHLGFRMPVALKTLHFEVSGPERALALAALHNEARVLARLQHPNVVRVYDLFQAGGEHYLVLQYVDGGSLQGRLEKDGPLGWQLAARYVADVGEALLHVHNFGVVHCDVKPANLLWDRQRDEALLTDFGLASRLANSGQVAGTPLYMAPEAFAGRSTPAGDVYGLAASLFALVTGRVPFPAATRAELLERIRRGLPDPEPLLAGLPQRLEQVVRSGLAAAPERRPELGAFVADLRGSLNRLLADSLVLPAALAGAAAPVDLRLTVSRREGGAYVPLAGTPIEPCGLTRDMQKVPPPPEHIGLRTGDRVRVEVAADRDGFVTVFNVGPTGHLNLLYPDPTTVATQPVLVPANRPLHVTDVALTPPAGNERLFAVWSRIPLSLEKVVELTRGDDALSPSYRATRNMERVQESVQRLRREDWHAVVLELDHTDS